MYALQSIKSNRGTALVTGMIVMLMVSLLGIAYVTLTSTNLIRAGRDERRTTALHLAEAGVEYVIAQVIEEGTTNGGIIVSKSYEEIPTVLNTLRTGATGSVVVNADTSKTATITSIAHYRDTTETVRVRVEIRLVGVWDNAIFAGMGQAGLGINGNVRIAGSVHILGEGEPFSDLNGNGVWDPAEPFVDVSGTGDFRPDLGDTFTDLNGNGVWDPAEPFIDINGNGVYDPPLTATELASDLSGGAYIGNNYSGMSTTIAGKIPALVPQTIGGEVVQTLNAEVRVKYGKVNLSGNATIGKQHTSGNGLKDTIDGCYVTHGYGGNQGTTNVYSDNGTNQGYDLGDRVPFPYLSDSYTDPATGIAYTTYEDYLVANSALVEISNLTHNTVDFNYGDGALIWNQATRTLTVNGIVRIPNNFDINLNKQTLNYQGRGTIFVQGDVSVHNDVLPVNTFPTVDVLGVIAKNNINLATGGGDSQLKVTGAWYAQGQINSAKQSEFAGTFVASYFNMGNQVPSIFQVPTLSQNLPPGMPGGDSVAAVRVLSWRHL